MKKNVAVLFGDPRKGIIKLSYPVMIGMFFQMLYNVVDGIFVAWLGKEELASIGLFFSVFVLIMSFANGIGIGASSFISRKIGEEKKELAGIGAISSIILGVIFGIFASAIVFLFVRDVFFLIGVRGKTLDLVVTYGRIISFSIVFLFVISIGGGIVRGEGDPKKAMFLMIFGAILNGILDPIFIFSLNMGFIGAGWSTSVSIFLTSLFVFYWLFKDDKLYVGIRLDRFYFSKAVFWDILRVGFPSSFSQIVFSIAMFIINAMVVKSFGDNGVAIFTASWRVIAFGIIPVVGVASSITSLSGASYGRLDFVRLKKIYKEGIFIGLIVEMVCTMMFLMFSDELARIYTYKFPYLIEDISRTIRYLSVFLPFLPFSMITGSMFQGIGYGKNEFVITFVRVVVLELFLAYFFGFGLGFGFWGIVLGIILGNILAGIFALFWGSAFIKSLKPS